MCNILYIYKGLKVSTLYIELNLIFPSSVPMEENKCISRMAELCILHKLFLSRWTYFPGYFRKANQAKENMYGVKLSCLDIVLKFRNRQISEKKYGKVDLREEIWEG